MPTLLSPQISKSQERDWWAQHKEWRAHGLLSDSPTKLYSIGKKLSPNVNWGAITKTTKMVKGERGAFLMRLVRITHSLIYVRRVSYLSYLYLRLSTLWLNQCCLCSFSLPPLAYSPEGSGHSSCIIWKMVSWRSPVLYFKINKEILWGVNLGKSKCIFLHSTIENFYKFLIEKV